MRWLSMLIVLALGLVPVRPVAGLPLTPACSPVANEACCPPADCCCHVTPGDQSAQPPGNAVTPLPGTDQPRIANTVSNWRLGLPSADHEPRIGGLPFALPPPIPLFLQSQALLI